MSVTPQAFHFHLQKLTNAEKYLIAYSGGVDSHVLLHLCARIKNSPQGTGLTFSAVYIDHGLSPHAKKWGRHCQQICYKLDIPLTIIEVDGRAKPGQSPEATARTVRYQAFSQILTDNECLLTAQHLDDQAETLLLQLLRGSGTRGLSAMPEIKAFAKGALCRPILAYKKQAILDYAAQHELQWVEDESNQQQRFDRNYLRHSVLPLLQQRWPAVKENFAKSAAVLAESQLLLDDMAVADMQPVLVVNAHGGIEQDKILLAPLLHYLNTDEASRAHSLARLNNILRHWIYLNQLPMPSRKILHEIVFSLLQAREDAMPLVSWRRDTMHCEVRRYRDKLYLLSFPAGSKQPNPLVNKQQLPLSETQAVELEYDIIKLIAGQKKAAFERQQLLSKPLSVRFRQGGERYRKKDNEHSHPLKHWFQEQGVPPWERDSLPLIYHGDELLQIGNTIVNQSLINEQSDDLLSIHWQRNKNN